MDNYIVISFVGEGSFGRVFKAKHKHTNAFVALKVIRKKGRSSKDLKNLRQECDIQRQLDHPNIIRMIDSFETESELVVVTEYAEKELHSILAKEGCLSEEQVKNITWDLVSALYYLHSHRVLHRDLKPQNVLLDSTGRAKLCDFGLARIMTNATHILTSIKGTPLYMAPELIDEKPYDHQADLWSLGCIVYELMAGQPPFCTMSIWQLVRMIRHKPVQWPSFISVDARSFLQGLLHKDPIKRMSWPEILEHPFVAGRVLILPEDKQSDSPFTKPLTCSQQEAKFLQTEKISKNAKLMAEKDLFDYNSDDYWNSVETCVTATKRNETNVGDTVLKEKISTTDILFSVHNLPADDGEGEDIVIVLYECTKNIIVSSKIKLLLEAVESAHIENQKSRLCQTRHVLNGKMRLCKDVEDIEDSTPPFKNLNVSEQKAHGTTNPKVHVSRKKIHSKLSTHIKKNGKKYRKSRPETWQKNIIIKNNLRKHKFRSISVCRCECKNKISESAAKNIFRKFINLKSHTEQNMYLQGCLQEVVPQRRRLRKFSGIPKYRRVFKYFVGTHNKKIESCQKAFIDIHGIKKDRLQCKVQQREKNIQDGRGRHNNHRAYDQTTITKVRNYLENLSSKNDGTVFGNKVTKILDSSLSVAELHRMYIINNPDCEISYEKFRQIFNIAFETSFKGLNESANAN